jgi:hypothetical protein
MYGLGRFLWLRQVAKLLENADLMIGGSHQEALAVDFDDCDHTVL